MTIDPTMVRTFQPLDVGSKTVDLRHLAWYGGVPVPYTMLWTKHTIEHPDHSLHRISTPTWTNLDPKMVEQCLRVGLCGLCGRALVHQTVAYIAGLHTDITRLWAVDPPMHVECTKYSLSLCPHLSKSRTRSTGNTPPAAVPDSGHCAVLVCRGYRVSKTRMHSRGRTLVKAWVLETEPPTIV